MWVILSCSLCASLAQLLDLTVDDLIRYTNGNFVLIYLLSTAADVVLLRGIWRALAAFSALLCGLVLLMLGMDAAYALGLLLLGALDRWREHLAPPALRLFSVQLITRTDHAPNASQLS